jgi:hypothetical protein
LLVLILLLCYLKSSSRCPSMSLWRCLDRFTTLFATFEIFTPMSSVLPTYPLNSTAVYNCLPLCLMGQSRSCSSTSPQQRHKHVSFVTFGF